MPPPTKDYCKKEVWRDPWGRSHCKNTVVRDGWCTVHHPDAITARREKSEERWQAERLEGEQEYQHRKKREAQADLFPELVAMLERELLWMDFGDREPQLNLLKKAKALL